MNTSNLPGMPPSGIVSRFVPVKRVLWTDGQVERAEKLVGCTKTQVSFAPESEMCTLISTDKPASILLDFGCELHGFVRPLVRFINTKNVRVRVRFGESANEAMADIGEKNATNDHINRDVTRDLQSLYMPEFGPTGFRFVRIDLLTPGAVMALEGVIGILRVRDLPYKGSFNCPDERLNQIWKTGAYTVQLCMQDYVWDGIKRDRLVWLGDMHPETSTIQAVFGQTDVVRASLDLARDTTPLPSYINGIESYSIWWIRNHKDHYIHYGDMDYLKEQYDYLKPLTIQLANLIGEDGRPALSAPPFIEWPSCSMDDAKYEGFHGLMHLGLLDAAELLELLGDGETWESVAKLEDYLEEDTLAVNNYAWYTIEWKWLFEEDVIDDHDHLHLNVGDALDTLLGNVSAESPVNLSVSITTLAQPSENMNAIGGVDQYAGDEAGQAFENGQIGGRLRLWPFLILVLVLCAVAVIFGYQWKKERERRAQEAARTADAQEDEKEVVQVG